MGMHIISLKMLREFWEKHPEAEQVLKDWHSVLEKSTAKDFNELKNTFNSADYVPPYTRAIALSLNFAQRGRVTR